MKRTDIRAGVVYAYQRSRSYGSPEPVVFLVAPSEGKLHATASTYRKPGQPAFVEARPGSRPGRGSGFSGTSYGYAAVKLTDRADNLDDLLKPTLADFEKCPNAYTPRGFDGLEFFLVTSLTHITGEYETELAAYKSRREAEAAESKRERDENARALERSDAILSRLGALGIDAESDESYDGRYRGYVRISVDDAEKLIALLRDREG